MSRHFAVLLSFCADHITMKLITFIHSDWLPIKVGFRWRARKNAYGGGRTEGKATPGEGRPRRKRASHRRQPTEARAGAGPRGGPTARQRTKRSKGPRRGRGGGEEPAEASRRGGEGTEGSHGGRQPRDTRSVLDEEDFTEKGGRTSSPQHLVS